MAALVSDDGLAGDYSVDAGTAGLYFRQRLNNHFLSRERWEGRNPTKAEGALLRFAEPPFSRLQWPRAIADPEGQHHVTFKRTLILPSLGDAARDAPAEWKEQLLLQLECLAELVRKQSTNYSSEILMSPSEV